MISAFAGLSWFAVLAEETARYLIVVGAFALLTQAWRPAWIERRWVQRRMADGGDVRREILASFVSLMIFASVIYLCAIAADHGILRVYHAVAERGWPYLVFSTVLILVAHDLYFYVTHRMLHARFFYRFHLVHHRSHAPTPWAAYSFHPVEALVQIAFVPLYLLLVPTHPFALAAFITYLAIADALGHCGHEVMPLHGRWSRMRGFAAMVTFHDLHHSAPQGNFGLYSTVWDRLFGTIHPRYKAELARVAERSLNRP